MNTHALPITVTILGQVRFSFQVMPMFLLRFVNVNTINGRWRTRIKKYELYILTYLSLASFHSGTKLNVELKSMDGKIKVLEYCPNILYKQ